MDPPAGVDFHFDIMCPYAYQTSLWIREVRDLTGLDVRWRFFSLEEINRAEGKKHPWEREWSYGWSMMRIGAYPPPLGHGPARPLVPGGRPGPPRRRPQAASARRWPRRSWPKWDSIPALVGAAIADPTTGDEVLAEHETVVAKGGFGVPTLVFDDGQALFGPVLVDPPSGEEAVRLWEHVTGWLEFPHVYELQRPKSPADIDTIARPSPPTSRPATGSASRRTPRSRDGRPGAASVCSLRRLGSGSPARPGSAAFPGRWPGTA